MSLAQMRCLLAGFLLVLSACGALPQDPQGTLDRIGKTKQIQIGLVAGTPNVPEVQQLINEIEVRAIAHAQMSKGSAEDLLQRLSTGKVDLVVGAFAKDSPWKTMVAFGPAVRTFGAKKDLIEVKGAMRNGENRWIMLVERASRTVSRDRKDQ